MVLIRQRVQLPVQLRIALVPQEAAAPVRGLEGRPGLNGHAVQAGVIQHAFIPAGGARRVHVDLQAVSHHVGDREAELELVNQQRLPDGPLEQLDLHGLVVGDAEAADLSRPLQLVKGGRNLLRLGQRVGAVNEQHVQIIGPQATQDAVYRPQQMLPGGVVEALPDAALGLQDQVLPPDGGVAAERRAEMFLTGAASVDVGVVKVICAVFQRGVDKASQSGRIQLAQTHTAHYDGRDLPAAAAQWNLFHDRFPFPFLCWHRRTGRPAGVKIKGTLLRAFYFGGDGEIRTLDTLLGYTRFPIVRARPATRHLHIVARLSSAYELFA